MTVYIMNNMIYYTSSLPMEKNKKVKVPKAMNEEIFPRSLLLKNII